MAYDPRELGARCDMCPFRGARVVPPAPATVTKLVIVGEGPGRHEEKEGAPFIGQSGKMLDGLLAKNRIKRSDCHVTNATLCRGEGDKNAMKAAECCAPRLLKELGALSKDAPVVALGKIAAKSLLNFGNILVARGFIWKAPEIDTKMLEAVARSAVKRRSPTLGLKADTLRGRAALAGRVILPILHPAFILRADTWHPLIKLDFRRVARVLSGDSVREDEVSYVNPKKVAELYMLGDVVAVDVETDGVNPMTCGLLCVGVANTKRAIVIWPWKRKWARPLAKFLRSRKEVVAHNGQQFDSIVLEQHGVS